MGQVISFAGWKNEKAAAAKVAKAEEAKAAKEASLAADVITGLLEGDVSKAVNAADEINSMKKSGEGYMPAYCDPNNEYKGSKYDSLKSHDVKDIAKLIRKDIKEAVSRGDIPKGKYSVTIDRFSGGSSIDIRVKGLDGENPLNPEYVKWWADNPNGYYGECPVDENLTPLGDKVIEALNSIMDAYKRDNSDMMSDYFDVNFYGHVAIDWEAEKAWKEEILNG